eukprot:9336346-Alexandrium_andersonii.AAC.1
MHVCMRKEVRLRLPGAARTCALTNLRQARPVRMTLNLCTGADASLHHSVRVRVRVRARVRARGRVRARA